MSPERVVYAGLLTAAAFWAVMSAVLLLQAPHQGDRSAAWFWGAVFAVSSIAAAWFFGELL